jgi:hypothetical protein
MVNTNTRLSDLQFSQIIVSLSDVSLLDPQKVYQYYYTLNRRRMSQVSGRSLPDRFWRSNKLQTWATTTQSDISIVMGNFHSRLALRGLCVDIIEQLREYHIPVLLSMRMTEESTAARISSIDLLKYLVKQAVNLNRNIRNEKSMALSCARFHSASTETDWFQLLESVVADIGQLVYFIIDLEVLDCDLGPVDDFSWLSAFQTFFSTLSKRLSSTRVKVLLINYGSRLPFDLSSRQYAELVVPAKSAITPARQRRTRGTPATGAKRGLLKKLPVQYRSGLRDGLERTS